MRSHLVNAAADLLVGAECPGCGTPCLRLCRACGAAVQPSPRTVVTTRRIGVPVVASHEYSGIMRSVVVDWKEHGREPLTGLLGCHLAAAIADLVTNDRVVLVPVPSSWSARVRRGRDHVRALADDAARRLDGVGVVALVEPLLGRARSVVDQAGLDARRRSLNVRRSLNARSVVTDPHAAMIVVDDVVTTGATAAEAVRAMRARGHSVVGVATVAATPRA